MNLSIPNFYLKLIISIVACAVFAVRTLWPDLKIDTVSLGLIVVAIVPWLTELIESAKFPGGWEVKFRDVRAAGDKVTAGHQTESISQIAPDSFDAFETIAKSDKQLALVMLRIEIEKRLRAVGALQQLDPRMPLARLTTELASRQLISDVTANGLLELISAGNSAAHGAKVPDQVQEWCTTEGPRILASLDAQLNLPPSS